MAQNRDSARIHSEVDAEAVRQGLSSMIGSKFVKIAQDVRQGPRQSSQLSFVESRGLPGIVGHPASLETTNQAKQPISAIVANRTSLAAAAQAINAPTPAVSNVQGDLVAAFNASLQNDNDLATCLNQANDGNTAYIFQGCMSASASDGNAATAAKQTFLTAYNQLRASIGQAAINPQF